MGGIPFSAMFPTSDKTHTLPVHPFKLKHWHGNFVEKGKPPTKLHRNSCEEGEASRNGKRFFFYMVGMWMSIFQIRSDKL